MPDHATLTVAEWGALWIREQRAAGRPRVTVDAYRARLEKHVYPVIGGTPLSQLRRDDIVSMVAQLEGRMAASSVHYIISAVRQMFAGAVRDGLILHSPVSVIDLPRIQRRRHFTKASRVLSFTYGQLTEWSAGN